MEKVPVWWHNFRNRLGFNWSLSGTNICVAWTRIWSHVGRDSGLTNRYLYLWSFKIKFTPLKFSPYEENSGKINNKNKCAASRSFSLMCDDRNATLILPTLISYVLRIS